ncbi:uncharacterized protein AC631_03463 [Debaryomyces fabryi]|uniref:37S ribosomal protein YMR-31, mitochondrial n=1 Tax=Debaryomyces fabryi TaxID=58627 RepID=A0A0V1PX38_9ASCO|nr:uncharacterized protein AC631_03463 [Debaryomyces fabryi]KSA00752.1 hypothetical protein AC631_03463 [Debaryomyces fabryi]CUM45175.1 unnamed protein product [Debaryomyces fabryi]
MRPAARLLQRVPLIKFVGGPHPAPKNISHAAKPHPCAPDGALPGSVGSSSQSSYFNSNPIEPKDGEAFSRAELPARFRYKGPSEAEIENITSGGAALIF